MLKQMRNEQGGTLVLYTVAMVGMMGMAALAIDLGMLRKARAEAQRGADAAALAGASAFLADLPRDVESTMAVALALKFADTNYMNGVKFDISEITVKVIPDSVKVRVKARRAAVPTWFARIFGINTLPVGAVAAAEASYASGAACVKPIVMGDLWDDGDDDTNNNEIVDGTEQWDWNAADDVYHPAHWDSDGNGLPNDGDGEGLGSELRNDPPGTSPGQRDWGRRVLLKPPVNGAPLSACPALLTDPGPSKCYVPSFWGWWGGNPKTRAAMLTTCVGEAVLGEEVLIEPGITNTLNQEISDVLNRDPSAVWNPALTDPKTGNMGTVTDSHKGGQPLGADWLASDRVWIIAIMAPDEVPTSGGNQTVPFNNFMSFFVEGCYDTQDDTFDLVDCKGPHKALFGRFVGAAKGTLFGPSPGTTVRILRLVE